MEIVEIRDLEELQRIGKEYLSHKKQYYPYFDEWYKGKVANRVSHKAHQLFVAVENHEYVGFLIIKNWTEKKISLLYVPEEYQCKGIGTKLLEFAIEQLGTKYPLITVPAPKTHEFNMLFNKFNFRKTALYYDYYGTGHNEVAYNGYLI